MHTIAHAHTHPYTHPYTHTHTHTHAHTHTCMPGSVKLNTEEAPVCLSMHSLPSIKSCI